MPLGSQHGAQNLPKTRPKSMKNRWKMDIKNDKIGSWAPRGSKSLPRALQDPKGTPRGHRLGEGFWEGFGAMLAPRATKNQLKMHSKFWSIFISIFDRFWVDFGKVLGGFWGLCWLPRCIENGAPILIGFLIDFFTIFTDFWSLETLILTNSPREILVFENQWNHRFFRFLSILGAILASKNLPKSIKNRLKIY